LQSAEAAATVVKEIQATGGEAHAFQADVASKEQIFRLIDEVVHRWGRLDILVNNAATPGTASAVEDVAEDTVESVLATNFKGPLWGIQAASKVLKSGGSIVNITSVASRGLPVRSGHCISLLAPTDPQRGHRTGECMGHRRRQCRS
jgi:3-oxoacyl-[acyl-carrier protein] reductase